MQAASAKVRLEILADFGAKKGQVVVGGVVDATYAAFFKAVVGKLQLKKKEAAQARLYLRDGCGVHELSPGEDLSESLAGPSATVVVRLGGGDPSIGAVGPSKAVVKALATIRYVEAAPGCGWIAARGCPSVEQLHALCARTGLTGLVTLLRPTERLCAAADLGVACEERGLRWCHAPLRGARQLQLAEVSAHDFARLATIRCTEEWLRDPGARIIVHCSAGLHRTGFYIYLLLRRLGLTPDEALARLREIRSCTCDEFERLGFQGRAETVFGQICELKGAPVPNPPLEDCGEEEEGEEEEEDVED